jgi:hypothetical protein
MIGRLFLAAMALAIPTAGASAAIIVQDVDVVTTTGLVQVAPFDPSLGTLNSVYFSIGGDVSYDWAANGEGDIDTELELSIDPDLLGGDGSYVGGFSADQFEFVLEFLDENFNNAKGTVSILAFQDALYTDPAVLAVFLASAVNPKIEIYDFQLNEDTSRNSGPSYSGSFGPVSGKASLTYNYTPAILPVPEPASWAMMIAGFGLAGVAMRRRRMVPVAA